MTPRHLSASDLRLVFVVFGTLLALLAGGMGFILSLQGDAYDRPTGLRPAGGWVEQEFSRRMEREGHEVAYYAEGRVSVLVPEATWAKLGQQGRFERHRFLSNCKATLATLQRERGDKLVYVMSIKSKEAHRLLAEETDFNPKFYD